MGKRKALVIGLDYLESEKRLKCGVRNAKSVKASLVKHLKFRPKDIILMTDGDPSSKRKFSGIEVTAEAVGKQLSTLIENGKKGDVLMVYFCGHGNWVEATEYMNNSSFIEMMIFSNKTSLRDTTFRDFTETVPEGCTFSALIDCCHSGAMIEGAQEIIGNSTRNPTINKPRTPKNKRFNFGKPSNRSLGVQISACQNHQRASQKYFKEGTKGWSTYFTQNMLSVIDEIDSY